MKNILITGVSKGLGLIIAEVAINQGYTVYGISRSKTDEFEQLRLKLPEQILWKSVDLGNKNLDLNKIIFKEFINNKIPIHGYVNNAAIAYDDIITNLNIEKLDNMFQVNVYCPMVLTKYCIRNMIYNRVTGSIIHISSVSVHTGYKGLSMYAATKGAIEAFSKNTAREWGELGIRSNCIVAGFMETDMSKILKEDQKTRIYNRTSLKKSTSLESVAETVVFLLSEKADSITGQNIFVDSGTI
ncbi:MAG: SDR family oxidoreductase [Prolixibacteraceae bacterium]|jgi:3-oxoacyl-[acyl-carrier protein] reductase|nr:SDR family oxidoreductase [Prolixibacteraceae bacterium]